MMIFNNKLKYLSISVIGLIAAALVFAYKSLNLEFLYYGIIVGLEIALILYMEKRVNFSIGLLWAMAFWCAIHFAGGLMPIPLELTEVGRPHNLYNLRISPYFPRFDQVVHFGGFAIGTLFCYEAMKAHFKTFPINAANAGILFLCGGGLGAMNEVIEFIAVILMPETNVGGYINTGWDLVCNSLGSLAVISYLKFKQLLWAI